MCNSYRLIVCLLVSSLLYACTLTQIRPDAVHLKLGDDTTWASKQLNEQSWQTGNGINQKQLFWLRFKLTIDSSIASAKPLALQVIALGAYTVYWDGKLLGHSGKVGTTSATEVPGKYITYFLLPDSLSQKGAHVVALRVSNFHSKAPYSFYNIRVANYEDLLRKPLINSLWMYLLAGIFLIVSLYYFFLYTTNRKELPFLLFACICLLFFCLILTEYAVNLWPYRYDYQTTRLELIGGLTFAIAFIVPYFFYRQFRLPHSKILVGVMLLVLIAIYIGFFRRYDLTAQLMSLVMWLASVGIVSYSVFKKINGSRIVLLALLVSSLPVSWLDYDYSLFLSFGIVVISMLYLLAIRSKEIDKAYRETLLLSERLKIELLKKNIQPHFLMNTLTSLIDWIEESPRQSIVFIEALANEFELLGQMTDARLVPIETEINLCKSHLEVMQFRKEINYVWEDHGIDPTDTLPPALLHTVVENGITHSSPLADGSIRFVLNFNRDGRHKRYLLETIAINRTAPETFKKGTGLHYMTARLTESYGKNWVLHSEATKEGWLTRITIHENRNY